MLSDVGIVTVTGVMMLVTRRSYGVALCVMIAASRLDMSVKARENPRMALL